MVVPSTDYESYYPNAQLLCFEVYPEADEEGYKYTDSCYDSMRRYCSTMRTSTFGTFALVNGNYDIDLKHFIFIPKDSNIKALTIRETPITGTDTDGTILIDGSAPADKIEDFLDQAIEVQEGVDISLEGKTPIEVNAQTEIYYRKTNVVKTSKTKGYLLHFTNPSEKKWTLMLKGGRISYVIGEDELDYAKFAYNDYNHSAISNDYEYSSWYIFVSEDIVFDYWQRLFRPEEFPEALEKDKVNIPSWDDDFHKKLEAVIAVYPELKDKINYINLGLASEEMIPIYKDVLDGKYNGYTILFPVDINSVSELIDKAPALSKIGYKDSYISNGYKYLTEMGKKNGELRAVSWQMCPNCFYYNASIARKVLGTDDPAKVQEMISTPAKFNAVAKKMKAAGYYMTAGMNMQQAKDNIKYSTVETDIFHGFVTLLKTYQADLYDKGGDMWDDVWSKGMSDGTVFGYFGTTWMEGVFIGNGVPNGTMRICAGPISYVWGGTFVMAKDMGTQKEAACKVLKAITADEKVVKKIATRKDSSGAPAGDFVNNKAVNESLIAAGTQVDPFFGGKADAWAVWHEAALKLGNESEVVTGWQTIDGKTYYYDSKGVPVKGLKKIGTKTYYFNTKTGVMQTGIQKVSGKSYFFDAKTGEQKTGWQQVGKAWYYFVPKTGVMATGWQQIGKAWYYFEPKTGAMASGWKQIGKSWYYFVPKTGAMKTGWLSSGGKWYYFNKSGVMVTGSVTIGSKTYKFNSSGVCLNP